MTSFAEWIESIRLPRFSALMPGLALTIVGTGASVGSTRLTDLAAPAARLGEADRAVTLSTVALALSYIGIALTVAGTVYMAVVILESVYLGRRSPRRSGSGAFLPQLAEFSSTLGQLNQVVSRAHADLAETEAKRIENERLISLTREQVEAVRSTVTQEIRQGGSGRVMFWLTVAGVVIAVAGLVVAIALAP